MLKTVLARAGSKKTEYVLNKIKKTVEDGTKKVMFLVPEQSSFDTEKELYLALGDRDYAMVEVVSFTRLCSLIKAKFGGKNGERISSAGKLLLSAISCENSAPDLEFYASQSSNLAFATEISGIIDELKVAGISPKDLADSLESFADNDFLYHKLKDISKIYLWYDALLESKYIDPSDSLSQAAESLADGSFFEEYDVIIDEFASFNSSQIEIISKMLASSREVTLILCAKENSGAYTIPAFKTPLDTLRKIKLAAQKNSVEVSKPEILAPGECFENEDLIALEKMLCGELESKYESAGNITIKKALSVKEECLSVAADIRRLVMSGMRYRDIAVIGRDIEGYLPFLEDSFRVYGIPYFASRRADLDTRAATVFVINLLETVISSIDPSALARYLKCAVSPIGADDSAEFENYIDLWKINKTEIVKDFTKNPNGLEGEMDEDAILKLNRLNEIRRAAVTPLVEFKNSLKGADGQKITKTIYSFMKQNGVLQRLSDLNSEIARTDSALAAEGHRAFEACLNVMSQLSAILKGQNVTLKRYLELFKMALNSEDVGSIPHHLDEVLIGDAVQVRTSGIKASFLVGMNDGVFPKRHSESGLFSDSDRKSVRQAGIDVLTPSGVMNQNEDYYLYCALLSPQKELHISYSVNNQKGEALFPSKVVDRIKKNLGVEEVSISSLSFEHFLGTDEAAFLLLCKNYHNNTPFSSSLREYFLRHPDETYRQRLALIDKGLAPRAKAISEKQIAALYGDDIMISPSQVDKYHLCQFAHFCNYGIRLNSKKKTEITAADSGTAIHEIMERLLKEYTVNELALLSKSELLNIIDRMLGEFLSLRLGEAAAEDNRTKYGISRLRTTIVPVMDYVIRELEESGFTPKDFELDIKRGRDIEPYYIEDGQGRKIGVYGKVDRVDILNDDDKNYLRIVDYKSGSKVFDKKEIEYGLNLQMFLYLFSIMKNGRERYGDLTASGVLYMPAKRNDTSRKEGLSDSAARQEVQKGYKMKGMLLDDEKIRRAAPFVSASFESREEFDRVQKKVEEIICQMAGELFSGNLAANPLYVGRTNKGCEYCEYYAICGFEEGDECRRVEGEGEE